MTSSRPPTLADATTNELLAMLEVMYVVASADNDFSPEERRQFLEHAESLSGGKLDSRNLAQLVDSWEKLRGTDKESRLMELATALPDEMSRRIAYGLAQGVANADGQLLPVEARVLESLRFAFCLEKSDADDIAASVRMSRRPPATE